MFIQLCNAYENVAFATYGSVNLDEPINATVLNMSIHVFFFVKRFWISTLKLLILPYSRTNSKFPEIFIIVSSMAQTPFYYYFFFSMLFYYFIMNGLLSYLISAVNDEELKNVCYAPALRLCVL